MEFDNKFSLKMCVYVQEHCMFSSDLEDYLDAVCMDRYTVHFAWRTDTSSDSPAFYTCEIAPELLRLLTSACEVLVIV